MLKRLLSAFFSLFFLGAASGTSFAEVTVPDALSLIHIFIAAVATADVAVVNPDIEVDVPSEELSMGIDIGEDVYKRQTLIILAWWYLKSGKWRGKKV